LTAARLTAQLLSGPPAPDPVAVAQRLLAIQGQDQRGARLAIRARSVDVSAADVDRALSEDRSLVISWLNRGTLHLVASDDYPWLHALTAPPHFTSTMRRLAQDGVSPGEVERGVAVITAALAEDGPLTREQLGPRMAGAGVRTEGQALIHILALVCLRGLAVRGPVVDGRHAYALVRDWLGEPPAVERERALAELARRYLKGHGPAGERDLAKWAGLPLRDVRAGLTAIASRLDERDDGLVDLKGRAVDEGALPPPKLLGAFDPVLLGWRSREPLLGRVARRVVVGGVFRPFALVAGRAVATWRMPGGKVEVEPFKALSASDEVALEAEAADVMRFLSA
jgi:uncharacterized protein YcaQ